VVGRDLMADILDPEEVKKNSESSQTETYKFTYMVLMQNLKVRIYKQQS
jgi:hypothetical protein